MALSKLVDVLKTKGVVGCYLDVGHKEGHIFQLEAAEMSDFQSISINKSDWFIHTQHAFNHTRPLP